MLNAWTDGKLGPQNQQWPPQLIVTKSKWKHLENTERTRGINVDQICIDQNLLFTYTVHAFRSFLVLSTWTSLNFVYGGCLLFPMFLFPPIFRKLEKNTQQFVTGQETREKEESFFMLWAPGHDWRSTVCAASTNVWSSAKTYINDFLFNSTITFCLIHIFCKNLAIGEHRNAP